MKGKHLLSIADLAPKDIEGIVLRAHQLREQKQTETVLSGKSVVLLFEKPSLRTRASFEVGIHQLGGHCFYMGPDEADLGVRETVADVTRVLSRYVDCIVARVFNHDTLKEMASYATVPVINALSDWEHPCQTLADLQTLYQFKGTLKGLKIAYVGDGNNVARSLCLGLTSVGCIFAIATPEGYELDRATLDMAGEQASQSNTRLECFTSPQEAVRGADAVYTDVWTSMGEEEEAQKRRHDFRGYTVDPQLLAQANRDALFMHDMPAHYGEEVPPGMLDHPQSVAFEQAENRLHAQKAVLELVLGEK